MLSGFASQSIFLFSVVPDAGLNALAASNQVNNICTDLSVWFCKIHIYTMFIFTPSRFEKRN